MSNPSTSPVQPRRPHPAHEPIQGGEGSPRIRNQPARAATSPIQSIAKEFLMLPAISIAAAPSGEGISPSRPIAASRLRARLHRAGKDFARSRDGARALGAQRRKPRQQRLDRPPTGPTPPLIPASQCLCGKTSDTRTSQPRRQRHRRIVLCFRRCRRCENPRSLGALGGEPLPAGPLSPRPGLISQPRWVPRLTPWAIVFRYSAPRVCARRRSVAWRVTWASGSSGPSRRGIPHEQPRRQERVRGTTTSATPWQAGAIQDGALTGASGAS